MCCRGVVATIATVGDDAIDGRPELLFHFRDQRRQCVAVVGRPRLGFDVSDKLTARRAVKRCRDLDFDAELIRPMRLAFTDAFDLWRVEAIDLLSRLPWTLKTNPLRQIQRTPKDIL